MGGGMVGGGEGGGIGGGLGACPYLRREKEKGGGGGGGRGGRGGRGGGKGRGVSGPQPRRWRESAAAATHRQAPPTGAQATPLRFYRAAEGKGRGLAAREDPAQGVGAFAFRCPPSCLIDFYPSLRAENPLCLRLAVVLIALWVFYRLAVGVGKG